MERNLVSDIDKVYQLWKDYAESLSKGDQERWLALWAEDGIQLPPDEPYRIGLDQLQYSLERNLEMYQYEKFLIYPEEVCILGDRAYTHGVYSALIKSLVIGKRTKICGKFLTILTKQRDGSWKIIIDCFNANVVGL